MNNSGQQFGNDFRLVITSTDPKEVCRSRAQQSRGSDASGVDRSAALSVAYNFERADAMRGGARHKDPFPWTRFLIPIRRKPANGWPHSKASSPMRVQIERSS